MCGRYVSPEEAAIARAFHLGARNDNPFGRCFNVFPTAVVPFLRLNSNSWEIELAAGRWGFVPHWWKQAKLPGTSINARAEEAADKPMWRDAWARARCLVPAEGWYEWQTVERTDPATGEIRPAKQPHFIRRVDGRLFCFAGLMSYWKDPQSGEPLRSCAIVTAAAEGPLAHIHERAPVVLPESAYASWLDRKLTDPGKVKAIAEAHVPPAELTHWKVRLLVNNAKADGPELIEPVEAEFR
jgi:putative SOS response-associated peptidase YedK